LAAILVKEMQGNKFRVSEGAVKALVEQTYLNMTGLRSLQALHRGFSTASCCKTAVKRGRGLDIYVRVKLSYGDDLRQKAALLQERVSEDLALMLGIEDATVHVTVSGLIQAPQR